jgi:hypothetical protein
VKRLAISFLALAFPVAAQDSLAPTVLAPEPASRAPVPFGRGERADYQVKFGVFSVGRAAMELIGLDTVRGREAWHILFLIRGGVPGYRVNDRMESWMDTGTLASLRFHQDMSEGSHDRERKFEIYPDSVYIEDAKEPQPTVARPLDDGSFLYFVRTIPLEVGKEYSFEQYFRPDRNPVRIQVLRKERIKVPAGTFETIVIRPLIKARGVFSENGRAEIWLTDDDRRLMVQMKSHMKLGSLSLFLRSYTPPTDSASVVRPAPDSGSIKPSTPDSGSTTRP